MRVYFHFPILCIALTLVGCSASEDGTEWSEDNIVSRMGDADSSDSRENSMASSEGEGSRTGGSTAKMESAMGDNGGAGVQNTNPIGTSPTITDAETSIEAPIVACSEDADCEEELPCDVDDDTCYDDEDTFEKTVDCSTIFEERDYGVWRKISLQGPVTDAEPDTQAIQEECALRGWECPKDFGDGTGTLDNPYRIAAPEDLLRMSELLSKGSLHGCYRHAYYLQTSDIDMKGHEFSPIGPTQSMSFAGVFDGDNHIISNLTYIFEDEAPDNYKATLVGLFGQAATFREFITPVGGTRAFHNYEHGLKNIHLENVEFDVSTRGWMNAGAIAGRSSTTLENCSATGSLKIANQETSSGCPTGGLVGIMKGSVIDSNANVDVTTECVRADIGGLIGSIESADSRDIDSISNCYATGEVSADVVFAPVVVNGNAGGLVGTVDDAFYIEDSYATGNVSLSVDVPHNSSASAGGLVGNLAGSSSTRIRRSYATGYIVSRGLKRDAFTSAGGLVGQMTRGSIESSYATGNAKAIVDDASNAYAAGLVARTYSVNVSDSYATGSTRARIGNPYARGYSGGLIGELIAGSLTYCYSFGQVLTQCQNSSCTFKRGGLAAETGFNSQIRFSFFNSSPSGMSSMEPFGVVISGAAEDVVVAKRMPAADFATEANFQNLDGVEGFNFDLLWKMDATLGRPVLVLPTEAP